MALPDPMRVLPGHTDETTIGREREHNPFVRVWSGAEPEGTERVRVGGRDATLLVWSPDYDGKGKAWVRYDDGVEAIVGGSRVERSRSRPCPKETVGCAPCASSSPAAKSATPAV